MDAKANIALKDEAGKTALDIATKKNNQKCIDALNGVPDEDELLKAEKKSKKHGQNTDMTGLSVRALRAKGLLQDRKDDKKESEGQQAAARGAVPKPVWPEVKEALESERCDLNIDLREDPREILAADSPVDPALWHCVNVNRLQLSLPEGVLKAVPAELGYMTNMLTLILSNNALTALPEAIGNLTLLKNLEVSNNQLTTLPESVSTVRPAFATHT